MVGVDNTQNPPIYVNSCVGSCGNPTLRPYQAKALDLTFEKYFGNKGYIAPQTYYKHFDTYINSQASDPNFDFSSFPKPPNVTLPTSPIGTFSGPVNTHGGHMYGAEVAATLPFDAITHALSGFGITGGIGYTKSAVPRFNGDTTAIPGYSKFVANLTAFYEKNGLSVRGSVRHRSGFLGEFPSFNGQPEQQYVLPETIYDAQIGYDFQPGSALEGLSVDLQGQIVTDERSATIGVIGHPNSWYKHQTVRTSLPHRRHLSFCGRATTAATTTSAATCPAASSASAGVSDVPRRFGDPCDGRLPGSASASTAAGTGAGTRELI